MAVGNPDAPLLPKLEAKYNKPGKGMPKDYVFNAQEKRLIRHACSLATDDILLCADITKADLVEGYFSFDRRQRLGIRFF